MSQYMSFFLRNKEAFLPLGSYGRSSTLYRIYNDALNAPYERLALLSSGQLRMVLECTAGCMDTIQDNLKKSEERVITIQQMNNTVEEKLEALYSEEDLRKELEEELEEMRYTDYFTNFLITILEEAEDLEEYGNNLYEISPEKYLYFGIEVGTPTIEDTMEED